MKNNQVIYYDVFNVDMFNRGECDQGVLAKRRSSFQGNQFPLATEVARKVVAAPLHYGFANRNKITNWNKPRYYVFL